MIHDYYCTNCGEKLKGEEVIFDLAQILDFQQNNATRNIFIQFTPKDLIELARKNRKSLEDGKKIQLKISLYDLLGFMAQDMEREVDRQAFQNLNYDELIEIEQVVSLLTAGRASGQNQEVITEEISKLINEMTAKLRMIENNAPEKVSQEEWVKDTKNYIMSFWIEPVFFQDEEKIYTIKYSIKENSANLSNLYYHGKEIRGYCPTCEQPALKNSGKYDHFLVGFLGVQSAGKTSLFVSMIKDIENYFTRFGIRLPELLCDEKYEKLEKAREDHGHGWAVKKTDAQATVESFNVSLLITKENKKVILTFVDIAGELCYNNEKKCVDEEAFQKFPLITACHLYLMCTCVSQKGYGENENRITNRALIDIGNGIYNNLRDPLNVPPMCLVITKVDMAQDTQGCNINKEINPFSIILNSLRGESRGDNNDLAYNRRQQLEILETLYNTTSDDDIINSLEWCNNTFLNNEHKTYVSMISCSALGMQGRMYDDEKHDYTRDGDTFTPMRLNIVWDWILKNIGISPVQSGGYLPYIPSYGEGYWISDNQKYSVRTLYKIEQEKRRTEAIYQLYLNPSEFDQGLKRFHLDDDNNMGVLIERILERKRQREYSKIIQNYLIQFQR